MGSFLVLFFFYAFSRVFKNLKYFFKDIINQEKLVYFFKIEI